MVRRVAIASLSCAVLAACFWPSRSYACSCAARAINQADPSDGSVDVPINQAIIVQGSMHADQITLTDAKGQAVEFQLNGGPTPGCPGFWAELDPKDDLRPNTEYVVGVKAVYPNAGDPMDPTTVRFRTGTSRLPERSLQAPRGSVTTVLGVPDNGSCSSGDIYACVGLDNAHDVEVLARRGDQIVMRWLLPLDDDDAQLWSGAFAFTKVPDCLEFRRRDRTGQRSAPLQLCGDALGTRPFRASDMGKYFFECNQGVTAPNPTPRDDAEPSPPSKPTVTPVDAGVERDQGKTPSESNAAGSAAPAAAEPQHHAYGCSALRGTRESNVFAIWMVLFAAALRRMRRR